MTEENQYPIVLHADEEHVGLRTAVVLILLGVILVIFLLLNAIWPAIAPAGLIEFSFVITCAGSLILGVIAVWGIEQWLKQVWHSGRSLVIDKTGIIAKDESDSYRLNWDGHHNLLQWRFELKGYKRGGRERRVPEKWVCLATQIQEGENRLIVFCYVSPKKADEFLVGHTREKYHQINPSEVFASAMDTNILSSPSRPNKIPNEYLTGKDGLYWLAEQNRWHDGFELSFQNYETFLEALDDFQ